MCSYLSLGYTPGREGWQLPGGGPGFTWGSGVPHLPWHMAVTSFPAYPHPLLGLASLMSLQTWGWDAYAPRSKRTARNPTNSTKGGISCQARLSTAQFSGVH